MFTKNLIEVTEEIQVHILKVCVLIIISITGVCNYNLYFGVELSTSLTYWNDLSANTNGFTSGISEKVSIWNEALESILYCAVESIFVEFSKNRI